MDISNYGANTPPAAFDDGPTVDRRITELSDKFFPSVRAEAYRYVPRDEAEVLTMPWGPRIDVIIDPRNVESMKGGRVRIIGRTSKTEVEIASVNLTNSAEVVSLSAAFGCDEYVVKASAGSSPADRSKEPYFFARVYKGR